MNNKLHYINLDGVGSCASGKYEDINILGVYSLNRDLKFNKFYV